MLLERVDGELSDVRPWWCLPLRMPSGLQCSLTGLELVDGQDVSPRQLELYQAWLGGLPPKVMREAQRYGIHAYRMVQFFAASGGRGVELSMTGGELICLALSYRNGEESQQHVGLVAEGGGWRVGMRPESLEDWRRRVATQATWKRRRIAEWLGLPATEGVVRILRRSRFSQWDLLDDLRALRCALARPRWARLLLHLPVITSELVRLLSDDEIEDDRIVTYRLLKEVAGESGAVLARGGTRPATLLRDLLNMWREEQPGRSLPPIRGLSHLLELHDKCVVALQMTASPPEGGARFPPPPMPGTNDIQPIESPWELRRESQQCHHCIASYAARIMRGEVYAYRVLAPERATLTLERTTTAPGNREQWRLSEISGVCNVAVGQRTLRTVRGWLRGEPADAQGVDRANEVCCERNVQGLLMELARRVELPEGTEPGDAETTFPLPENRPIRTLLVETFDRMDTQGGVMDAAVSLTGIDLFDERLQETVAPGGCGLLLGSPNDLRLSFGVYVALHLVQNLQPVLLLSAALLDCQLTESVLSQRSRVSLQKIRARCLNTEDWNALTSVASQISALPLSVPTGVVRDMDRLERVAHAWKASNPSAAVLIVADAERLTGGEDLSSPAAAQLLRRLRDLASLLGIFVLAIGPGSLSGGDVLPHGVDSLMTLKRLHHLVDGLPNGPVVVEAAAHSSTHAECSPALYRLRWDPRTGRLSDRG